MPLRGKRVPCLELNPDSDALRATRTLIRFFGRDDAADAVDLIIRGRVAGRLWRKTLYDFAPSMSKGVGDSDGGSLPGSSDYDFIRLVCPKGDYEIFVTAYDAANPPTCPHHRGTKLVPS